MSAGLNDFQKKLLAVLQEPLPVCRRPFNAVGERIGAGEDEVIKNTALLKQAGFIRRFRAIFNYHAFGRTASLVTAQVPQDRLGDVTDVINALDGVSHNYLRKHSFNLWFTMQASAQIEIEKTLRELSGRLDVKFYSLPALRFFKLDVRFDPNGPGDCMKRDSQPAAVDTAPKPVTPAVLNEDRMRIVCGLQDELKIITGPFDCLVDDRLGEDGVIDIILQLVTMGVIRKIAATADYRRLGFSANAIFCAAADNESSAERLGTKLASYSMVSHCYQRRTFPGWPYDIFAMMHAGTDCQLESAATQIAAEENIRDYVLLPTAAELKKQPVRYFPSAS